MKSASSAKVESWSILEYTDRSVRFEDGYSDNGICSYFLEIQADDGALGIYGPFDESVALLLPSLLPVLLHLRLADWLQVRYRDTRFRHCMSGIGRMATGVIDAALLDLSAKIESKSVADLLGKVRRRSIPVYCSQVGIQEGNSEAVDIALHWRDLGFPAQKWTVLGKLTKRREQWIEGLVEVLGPHALMIDLKRSLPAREVHSFCRKLEQYHPILVEEPCNAWDAAIEHVVEMPEVKLAFGEHIYNQQEFEILRAAIGFSVFQPDVVWFGGATEVVGALQKSLSLSGLEVVPHGASFVPALHVAAVFTATSIPYVEFHHRLERRRQHFYEKEIWPSRGQCKLPDGEGWGIIIDRKRGRVICG